MSVRVQIPATAIVVMAAGVAAALYVWKKGGIAAAAHDLAATLTNAAGAAATGAVGAAGAAVGLPTPEQTTKDPAVARYIIDHPLGGYWQASLWSSALALAQGWAMTKGSGKAPPAGSEIARVFPPVALTTGDFTRLDHDTSPADPGAAMAQATADAWPDLPGFGPITGPL